MKSALIRFALCALLLALLFLTGGKRIPDAQAFPDARSPDWNFDTVVEGVEIAQPGAHFLALDSNGHAHLVYGGNALYYSWWDGASWSTEVVDTNYGAGGGAALTLDISNSPHISYESASSDLNYAYKSGDAWVTETVDIHSGFGEIRGTDISLGLTGAQIAYNNSGAIKYAKKLNDGSWNIKTVYTLTSGTESVVLGYTSGPIFLQYFPHIAFCDGLALMHADYTAGYWQTEQIPYNCTGAPALDTDPLNTIHIGFPNGVYGLGDISPKHAYQTNGGWATESAGISASWVSGFAMDIDSGGDIYLSYGLEPGGLTLAIKQGDTWDTQGLDSQGQAGYYSSLRLDSNGNPHIAYFRNADKKLNYIFWDGSNWVQQTVREAPVLWRQTSLAVKGSGQPCIAYSITTPKTVMYACLENDTWQKESVDAGGIIYSRRALTFDSSSRSHLAYTLSDGDGGVVYAQRDGTGWITATVSTSGAHTSLALDSQGNPWIAYTEINSLGAYDGVVLTYWTGASWGSETVDANGSMPIIAMTDGDIPYLAYNIGDRGNPWFAQKSGGTWSRQVIDNAATTTCVDLALDSAGTPR